MLTRMKWQALTVCVSIALLGACSKPDGGQPAQAPVESGNAPVSGLDYHSFANTDDYRTTHIDLEFTVDFQRKVLEGAATLHLDRLSAENTPLVLDTRGLTIESVRAGSDGGFVDAAFSIGEGSPELGAPLNIELPADATKVAIRYETSPDALALQWLAADRWQAVSVPVHPGPVDPRAQLHTAAGHARCAHHLRCDSSHAARIEGGNERRQ